MKQKENELSHHENLIKLLEDDKVIAIKCLNDHGINTDTMFADRIPERESGMKFTLSITLFAGQYFFPKGVYSVQLNMSLLFLYIVNNFTLVMQHNIAIFAESCQVNNL